MFAKNIDGRFLIRLERGERVVETLARWCEREKIESAVFHAIGACKNTEIGYYNLETREYFFKHLAEDREVASMTGNVSLVHGKPFVHAHMVLSAADESLSCVGGHLKEAEVAVTLEVFLAPLALPVTRSLNEEIGLKLLDL